MYLKELLFYGLWHTIYTMWICISTTEKGRVTSERKGVFVSLKLRHLCRRFTNENEKGIYTLHYKKKSTKQNKIPVHDMRDKKSLRNIEKGWKHRKMK